MEWVDRLKAWKTHDLVMAMCQNRLEVGILHPSQLCSREKKEGKKKKDREKRKGREGGRCAVFSSKGGAGLHSNR